MDAQISMWAALIGAGLVLAVLILAGAHLLANYQGASYKCSVVGPRSAAAALDSEPIGRFSYWTLGRECEWPRADGDGTVVATNGAEGSLLLLAVMPAVASGGLAMAMARRRRYWLLLDVAEDSVPPNYAQPPAAPAANERPSSS